MDIYVLDSAFTRVLTLDRFNSFIWVERYSECGDFVLSSKFDQELLEALSLGGYIESSKSNILMGIEDIDLAYTSTRGPVVTVKGRSVEHFLERRIVWGQKIIEGSLQDSLANILDENVINPVDPDRAFPNFSFLPSTNPEILAITASGQYVGDVIYDLIKDVCSSVGIGYRVRFSPPNGFIFELYKGLDRTYYQSDRPRVVFSNEFDNMISSNYHISSSQLRTTAMVAGEGEWPYRFALEISSGPATGFQRREIFVDAKDVSSETEEGEMTEAEYTDQLTQRGQDILSERVIKEELDAQIDPTRTFVYGEDFFLGDTVDVVTEFGISREALVSELIHVVGESGEKTYPKFKIL